MPTAARVAAGPIAAVAGAGAVALAHAHPAYSYAGASTAGAALERWPGLALAARASSCGRAAAPGPLLSWRRSPGSPPRPPTWRQARRSLLPAGLLVAAAGRPRSCTPPTGRALVALGYAATVGILGLAVTAVDDAAASGCTICPRNLLLVATPSATTVARVGLVAVAAWASRLSP